MASLTTENEELLQLVSFKIGEEEFGVNILRVQEIIRIMQITQVPSSPDFVEGVVNLRGKVIPVIDLRIKLGMKKKPHDKHTRVIVLEVQGKTIGFIVDSVSEVLRIPKSITDAPPEIACGNDSDYITSVGKLEDRLLILLEMEKFLSSEEQEYLHNN